MESNKIKLLVLWDILCKNTDENHAMNADEIREELSKRGISAIRRVVANDIAALNDYGYEVLSYKKKYAYYYVVNRPFDTAEVVLMADALKSSKLTPRQKNELIEKLSNLLCCYQAESISKHLISFDGEKRSTSANFTRALLFLNFAPSKAVTRYAEKIDFLLSLISVQIFSNSMPVIGLKIL